MEITYEDIDTTVKNVERETYFVEAGRETSYYCSENWRD